jgi:hypothetical protein
MNFGTLLLSALTSCSIWHFLELPEVNAASRVQVTTDKASYDPNQPVVVKIANGLDSPVYALSGQTYCSIITVERLVNENWSPEGRCLVYGPPGWIEIAAGSALSIEIKPPLPSDQPLAPGQHRVNFSFRVGSRSGSSETVFSSVFLIHNSSDP